MKNEGNIDHIVRGKRVITSLSFIEGGKCDTKE